LEISLYPKASHSIPTIATNTKIKKISVICLYTYYQLPEGGCAASSSKALYNYHITSDSVQYLAQT
jgi:hypothetical protein